MSTLPVTITEGRYVYGFVALLDVLGWKDLVTESVDDLAKFDLILQAAEAMGLRRVTPLGGSLPKDPPGIEISQISDCILLTSSFMGGRISEFELFYRWLHRVASELLSLGLFVRGGVTNGLYYHRGSIAFGPAVNEAAALEEKGKSAMRIILGENAITTIGGHPITNIRKDGDINFFDVLASSPAALDPRNHDEERKFLDRIRPHIERHLATHKSPTPAVYEKYVWYANYFNQVAKECGAQPVAF